MPRIVSRKSKKERIKPDQQDDCQIVSDHLTKELKKAGYEVEQVGFIETEAVENGKKVKRYKIVDNDLGDLIDNFLNEAAKNEKKKP